MTCRALTSSATCTGSSPTGAGLTYDNEGQLVTWTSALTGTPTPSRDTFAYDGEGNRVAQQTNVSGTVSTTRYLAGGLEEVTTAGSTTTLTKYESVPGVCSVVIVGSGPSEAISYVFTDGLGSVSEALDGTGNVTAQQLYGPYGGVRYSSGTMPTAKGYTGQYADAASSGLDYYNARYYDATIGQFTSADTAGDGLNRYAYVADDPETNTDPTGRVCASQDDGMGARGCGGGGGGCTTNCSGTPPCIASCQSPCWPHCGSGGHGGSGKSGGNTQPAPGGSGGGPTYDQYGCEQGPGEKVCDAQSVAGNTSDLFVLIGAGFGVLSFLLGLLAAAIAVVVAADLASFFGIPEGVQLGILGAQVGALSLAAAALTTEAGVLAMMFGHQGRSADPSLWSYSSLEQFRQSVVGVVAGFAGLFLGISTGVLAVMSAMPIGFAATWGFQLGSALGIIGSLAFGIVAAGAINQEEAVMGYNPASS